MDEEKVSSKDLLDDLMSDMLSYLMWRKFYAERLCNTTNELKVGLDRLYEQMPGAKLKFLGVIRKQIETIPFIENGEKERFMKKLSEIRKLAKDEMLEEKIRNKFSKENGIRKDTAAEDK